MSSKVKATKTKRVMKKEIRKLTPESTRECEAPMLWIREGGHKVGYIECRNPSFDIARKRPGWLVPGLIPSGMLALIAGKGGIGKTTLALQIAVLGAAGLDTEGNDIPPFSTAIVCREDHESETDARLLAALASLPEHRQMAAWVNLFVIADRCDPTGSKMIDGEEVQFTIREPFNISDPELVDRILELRRGAEVLKRAPLRLVIIDPIKDIIPAGGDGNDETSVRAALRQFAPLEAAGVAVFGVTHLVKSINTEGITNLAEGIKGSGAWVDRARHVLVVGGSRERRAASVFVAKSNCGADTGRFLRYAIEGADLGDGANIGRVAIGEWDRSEDVLATYRECENAGKAEAKKGRRESKAGLQAIQLAAHIRDNGGKPINKTQAGAALGIRPDKEDMAALCRMVGAGEGGSLRLRETKGRGKPVEFYLDESAEAERATNNAAKAEILAGIDFGALAAQARPRA